MAKYTKRRDKRGYEWKSAYREKEALMLERGYPEVSPHDFYRELFPAGSLQQEPDKTIYCNCDDPTKSNFVKYFLLNFKELEIKKIYATSFSQTGHGLFFEYEGEPGIQVVLEDILRHTRELDGNGDFRSDECQRIMDDSDIIVTNPPFSLFREFFSNLIRKEKQFLIIGNVNSITYKEVFATLKDNRVWLGTGLGRWISGFIVPEHYDMYGTETELNENGEKIIATNDCLWLTNLDHKKRHEFIKLEKNYNPNDYPKYDNYDGINVNRTQNIPCDYFGAMGVPITFMDKYNPEQFEIIKFRKGDDEKDLRIDGKAPYFRILIKRRRA